ncbi:MAG: FtsX-like permease family protein, partial [Burkholderiaceae bacterium]|nr:FtsX-like permease family protein [Burkholderiaceae bacterium]
MLWRDARAGELRLLVLGLIIAVAAVTSVGFLADRVGRALERDAGQMMGADLKIDGDRAPAAQYTQEAQKRGLSAITTVQFPSMASAGDASQLVSLKAVPEGYPLRGTLRSADRPVGGTIEEGGMPAPGTVWVDAQLLGMLNIGMGDVVQLGDIDLTVTRVVTYEPDRGMQFVNVAPRALINSTDLPATNLLGPGARLDYHFLLAGPPEAIGDYANWVAPRLARGERLDTLETSRPEVRRALDRAQRFLALVALLAVLISAVAVALSARRFMLRHRDGMAVMRCLGASQAQITRMLLAEFAVIGLLASMVGALIGLGVHSLLIQA